MEYMITNHIPIPIIIISLLISIVFSFIEYLSIRIFILCLCYFHISDMSTFKYHNIMLNYQNILRMKSTTSPRNINKEYISERMHYEGNFCSRPFVFVYTVTLWLIWRLTLLKVSMIFVHRQWYRTFINKSHLEFLKPLENYLYSSTIMSSF